MIRIPKEWTEKCHECGGSGVVHKRDNFSLWTPDEYMQFASKYGPPKLDPKYKGADDVPPNAMICVVQAGASIVETCKEGITLARAAGCPVAFEFNEVVAICYADSDPSAVANAWHLRAHGET